MSRTHDVRPIHDKSQVRWPTPRARKVSDRVAFLGAYITRIRKQFKNVDVIVTSYETLRNDIFHLDKLDYNYCILDEGHIIKNTKTKLAKSIKCIRALKRLILSGTPIQNNVLELWSLFDFLMPGFLGTERQFNERFGKPIQLSRDAKASSIEQGHGAKALEALHKQILPFVLRRMKEEVLNDLPPKIIQDYECEMSPLQAWMYSKYVRDRANAITSSLTDGSEEVSTKGKHVFQALQYLRKLVNHPVLVMNPENPDYAAVNEKLKSEGSKIVDLEHAPKLLALKYDNFIY